MLERRGCFDHWLLSALEALLACSLVRQLGHTLGQTPATKVDVVCIILNKFDLCIVCVQPRTMDSARKRRKWDVAAPGGMPLSGNRAGIGAIGSGSAKPGLSGFITAQGLQIDPPNIHEPSPAPAMSAIPASANVKPILEQDIVARAKQEAQAVVERINAVCKARVLHLTVHQSQYWFW